MTSIKFVYVKRVFSFVLCIRMTINDSKMFLLNEELGKTMDKVYSLIIMFLESLGMKIFDNIQIRIETYH